MISKKLHFAIDKTSTANGSKKILLKRYKNYSPNKSNIIIVIPVVPASIDKIYLDKTLLII